MFLFEKKLSKNLFLGFAFIISLLTQQVQAQSIGSLISQARNLNSASDAMKRQFLSDAQKILANRAGTEDAHQAARLLYALFSNLFYSSEDLHAFKYNGDDLSSFVGNELVAALVKNISFTNGGKQNDGTVQGANAAATLNVLLEKKLQVIYLLFLMVLQILYCKMKNISYLKVVFFMEIMLV